jgi:hypothetical protein
LTVAVAIGPAISAGQDDGVPVDVKLSLVGDKKVFRMGETIRLNLSYTTKKSGYMAIMDRRTSIDKVVISPTTELFDVVKDYYFGDEPPSDTTSMSAISDKTTTIEISLNDFFRFESPGKYTVYLITHRIIEKKNSSEPWRKGAVIELNTNPVEFEIVPMSEQEESAEARRISLAIDNASDPRTKTRLAEELANLPGDGAVADKVAAFLKARSSPANNYGGAIYRGLFVSRNKGLMIEKLEAALNDVSKPLDFELVGILSSLRARQEIDASGKPYSRPQQYMGMPAGPISPDDPFVKADQYYQRLVIDSLQRRQGKSLYETAYSLLRTQRDRLNPETKTALRSIVVKNFDALDIFSREDLLGFNWEQIRDPSLVPSIERMLKDNSYPAYGRLNVHVTALKRLKDLDTEKARQYMAAEIRDPNSLLYDEVLDEFDNVPIPEVDQVQLEQIMRLAPKGSGSDSTMLRWRCELTAKFATESIYEPLMDTYKKYSNSWQPETRGLLLGYFARYRPHEALSLVDEEIKVHPELIDSLLNAFTKYNYPQPVADFFDSRLRSSDATVAGHAAYVISQHGEGKDRDKLEDRLKLLDPLDERQSQLQVELIMSLLQSKVWKLSDADKQALHSYCLNTKCKEAFHW